MSPKLEVRNTGKYGKGVFAKRNIKKDEILAIFGGYILSAKEELKLPNEFRDQGVQISENFVLTIIKKDEIEDGGYFNHSCNPNSGFKGQIFLVAMKNINSGNQVTFDYAMALSKMEKGKPYKVRCLCGSKNCRNFIKEDDWKNPELQIKYNGYFQWYLQEKINNLNKK